MSTEVPTREEIIAIIKELLSDLQTERTLEVRKGKNQTILRAIVPLHLHAARLAGSVVRLEEEGARYEIVPTVRALFETGVTAQWIAHFDDGLKALLNEHVRQRKNLMAAALNSDFRDAGQEAAALDAARDSVPFDTSSDGSARRFEEMCRDLGGGESLYALYRMLSGVAHPSVHVIDLYLDENAPEGEWPEFRGDPPSFDSVIWLHLAATSLVWSARAVSYFDRDTQRRNRLRRLAKDLGVVDQLVRSEHSYLKRMKRNPL